MSSSGQASAKTQKRTTTTTTNSLLDCWLIKKCPATQCLATDSGGSSSSVNGPTADCSSNSNTEMESDSCNLAVTSICYSDDFPTLQLSDSDDCSSSYECIPQSAVSQGHTQVTQQLSVVQKSCSGDTRNQNSQLSDAVKSVVMRNYRHQWETEFDWLEARDGKMFCSVCRSDRRLTNKFATTGAENCQKSTLRKHSQTKDHRTALEADILRRRLYAVSDNDEAESSEDNDSAIKFVKDSERNLFKAVYFAAKTDMANCSVNQLLHFIRWTGGQCSVHDISDYTVHDVQRSIVKVLDSKVIKEALQSPVFGLLVDESTDLSVHKTVIMYIRYVSEGEMKTKLIGNIRVKDGSAHHLTEAIVNRCQALGFVMSKLVGLGSDGASVMMGKSNGVGALLTSLHSPFMVHVHCLAHRLALACSQSATHFRYLQDFQSNINGTYAYFSTSAVRQAKLEDMQRVIGTVKGKLKEAINIRWLSMQNAVNALHKCYPAILPILKEDRNHAKAQGLHTFLTTYISAAVLCMFCDILKVMGTLCKSFQKQDVLYVDVKPQVFCAIGELENMKSEPGPILTAFQEACEIETSDSGQMTACWKIKESQQDDIQIELKCSHKMTAQFSKLREEYLNTLISNMKCRLCPNSKTEALLDAIANLTDPQSVVDCNTVSVQKSLEVVCEKFGSNTQYDTDQDDTETNIHKCKPLLDENCLRSDWAKAKAMMLGCYRNLSSESFMRRVISKYSDTMPVYSTLCNIALCIPLTSVECERGFSVQNRIKTKFRCSLTEDSLQLLMKLNMGPDFSDFEVDKSVTCWKKEKKRRYMSLWQKSKRRRLEKPKSQTETVRFHVSGSSSSSNTGGSCAILSRGSHTSNNDYVSMSPCISSNTCSDTADDGSVGASATAVYPTSSTNRSAHDGGRAEDSELGDEDFLEIIEGMDDNNSE